LRCADELLSPGPSTAACPDSQRSRMPPARRMSGPVSGGCPWGYSCRVGSHDLLYSFSTGNRSAPRTVCRPHRAPGAAPASLRSWVTCPPLVLSGLWSRPVPLVVRTW